MPQEPLVATAPERRIEELNLALSSAGVGTWVYSPTAQTIEWDDRSRTLFGFSAGDAVPYSHARNHIHPADLPGVQLAMDAAFSPGGDGRYESHFRTTDPDGRLRWLHCKGQAYFDAEGAPIRLAGIAMDETEQVSNRQKLEQSQNDLLASFDDSPVGIATIDKDEGLTFRMANKFYCELVGRPAEDIVNKPLLEALPEISAQGFDNLLRAVITTGEPFHAKEQSVEIFRKGILQTIYIDFTYQARRDAAGAVTGVLAVVTDVTEQVNARRAVEASEARLRGVIAAAPAGIGLFVGRDLIIEYPNQTFIDIVGKGPDIVGLPLREAMPELITEGQPFLKILDDVFTTGLPFISPASLVKIVQNGVLRDNYYNISYTPVYDAAGEVYAILDIAVDVTEQIRAQQKLAATEMELRSAVDLAELGNWSIDLAAGTMTCSPIKTSWLGLDTDRVPLGRILACIREEDRAHVQAAIALAADAGNDTAYDVEYTIVNCITGQQRILHSRGRTVYNEAGRAASVTGTSRDITIQRAQQAALEQEVRHRTFELQTTVEELAESNESLTHSNEELAQYAYVASHDLQEPLRKIRIFTDMLAKQEDLADRSTELIGKVSDSAARMSLLIKDLLDFSRLLKADMLMRPVDLTEVMKAVSSDFELTVMEKNARIAIGALPTITGVSLQMNQLFYNLLGNALKFVGADKTPEISVYARTMTLEEAGRFIRQPFGFSNYYDIVFTDNGIGFEPEYSEQIFDVFKRLHGRDIYPGSGIGLALCRRIIANHNGYLYAESSPGQGSTFHIILPDRQHDGTFTLPDNNPFTQ